MSEQRLDQIERILDNLVTSLVNERDARLAMRDDFEEFYQSFRQWAESTTTAVDRLVENAEADRVAIREIQVQVQSIQTQVQGVQTENRRILDYLFGQQNG